MIIEKMTGMYFDQYLKENVFDICGMKSTGYYELDRLPAKCANNYIYCADTKDYRTNIFSVDVKGTGAGGAFITVRDIISFWTNLVRDSYNYHKNRVLRFFPSLVYLSLLRRCLSENKIREVSVLYTKSRSPGDGSLALCCRVNLDRGYE